MAINQIGKGWSHKNTKVSISSPSVLDIAWAADIYEGEDSCCLNNKTQQVIVVQKDRWLIDQFQALFGGSVTLRKSYSSLGGPVWTWAVYGPRARGFLMTIFKFLSPRRKEQVRRTKTWDWRK